MTTENLNALNETDRNRVMAEARSRLATSAAVAQHGESVLEMAGRTAAVHSGPGALMREAEMLAAQHREEASITARLQEAREWKWRVEARLEERGLEMLTTPKRLLVLEAGTMNVLASGNLA